MIRALLGEVARYLCEEWAVGKASRIIKDRADESVYLNRYYLGDGPRNKDGDAKKSPWDEEGVRIRELPDVAPINSFVHHIQRSDDDDALHNHPWKWGLFFILAGGYIEERRAGEVPGPDVIERRVLRPFSFNFLTSRDFHRVDLLEHDAWTIGIVGPHTKTSWGFWDRVTGEYMYWKKFTNMRKAEKAA